MAKKLALVNGVPRMVTETALPTIYNSNYTVGAGGITTGVSVTLPSSQTYTSAELDIDLNGQALDPTVDFNYVGSPPRTQVSFTFDLVENDVLTFKIIRGP